MPFQSPESIARAASLIADADALIITAGAGMGVDSGLPDFRGAAPPPTLEIDTITH